MNSEGGTPDERSRDTWKANAAAWTAAIRQSRVDSRRITDPELIDVLAPHAPARVLDVGCGEGWLARKLAPLGFDVTGIDASEPLIHAARRLGGGTFHVLSYEALVAEPGRLAHSFDCIVCNFSLLSEDLAPVLGVLHARLEPAGVFVIQTVHPFTAAGEGPYVNEWRTEDFSRLGGGFPQPMPWFYRTFGSWIRELAAAGLSLVDCREPLHPDTGVPASLLLQCCSQHSADTILDRE